MEKQNVNIRQDDEIEINLWELIQLLWSRALIIILVGVLFGAAAIVGTKLLITPQYTSTTTMYVLNRSQDNNSLISSDMQVSTYLTKDYKELILSRTVAEGVIKELKLDMEPEDLISKVNVEILTDTRIVENSVQDENPERACEIANALREVSSEHIKNVMAIEAVNVVDVANVPTHISSPSLFKNGVLAGAFGVMLTVIVILVAHFTNDTIKSSEDVEKYLELSVLGNIPLGEDQKKSKKKKRSTKRNTQKKKTQSNRKRR